MQFGKAGQIPDALGWALAMLMSTSPAAAQELAGREKLRAHGEQEFRKDIVTVANGVYVAVGYSMANVTMIVGEGGTIIVDTTSKVDDAQAVKAEFAKISRAPVRAIIYTHAHPDHAGGASVFAGSDRPEIYSHQLFVDRVADVGRAGRDGGDQFASTLPDALYINGGTGTEMLSRVREALATGDFRWAAELADCILAVDDANVDAKGLEAQALTELGERQTSANARNYYLSVAQYLLRGLPPR